jgi:hypothetical protein
MPEPQKLDYIREIGTDDDGDDDHDDDNYDDSHDSHADDDDDDDDCFRFFSHAYCRGLKHSITVTRMYRKVDSTASSELNCRW